MVNEAMYARGAESSVIREIFSYANERKAQVGAEHVFDFSLGNPSVPAPDAVRASIERSLTLPPEVLHGYTPAPGMPEARQAVADSLNRRFGTSYGMADIFMTVGAAASVSCALHAVACPGEEVIVIAPYFPEYRVWIETAGATCVEVPADPQTFQIDVEAVAAAITPRTAAVIIDSPNNPTGDLMPLDLIAALCDACPGLVMVDEAYMEFAEPGASAIALLDEQPNLVVLRTFSKAFGEAGARCGYIIAAPDVIDVYAAVRQIYSVNVLSQAAALTALRERAAFDEDIATIKRERERVYTGIEQLLAGTAAGARVWPSSGNFLLVRLPGCASRVRTRLRDEYSILVRDFSAAPGLADCLRITIGTPAENDEVLAALGALVKEELA